MGTINPLNPYMDITPWVEVGKPIFLTLYLERAYGSPSGNVLLYEGNTKKWTLSSCQEEELLLHAEGMQGKAATTELPVTLEPGQMSWLYGSLPNSNEDQGWRIFCSGSHMKLTVLFNDRLVGRLRTRNGASRPAFSGGNQESFYLSGPWFRDTKNELAILLEAVELGEEASLDTLRFVPV